MENIQAQAEQIPTAAELETLAENDLMATVNGDKAPETPAAKPVIEEKPTETQTEEEKPVTEEVTETTEEEEETNTEETETPGGDTPPADEDKIPKRFRPAGTDQDKALAHAANTLVRTLGISLVEAMDRVTGRTATAPAKAEPETVQETVTAPTIAQKQAEVTALETQIEALEAENEDGLFKGEISKLNRQLAKAYASLEVAGFQATQQHQQQELSAAQMTRAWNTSLAEAAKAYPDLKDTESAHYLVASQIATLAKSDPKHPLHNAVFNDPNAPQLLADAAAKKLGIQPSVSKKETVTTPATLPNSTVKPAAGSKGTAAKNQPTVDDIVRQSDAELEDILMGRTSGAPRERLAVMIH